MKISSRLSLAAAIVILLFPLSIPSFAINYKVLRTFNGAPVDYPASGLIPDSAGNLYGVTSGAVYELSPVAGGYKYQTLALMTGGAADFAGGNLALDKSGNLYGATWQGGASGCGYVYEVSPGSGGTWTLSVIYNFDCITGAHASYTLHMDAAGNIYGGAHDGGSGDQGVAYELSPGASGWTYTVLHNFLNSEGNGPQTGLIFDSAGNLYGANETGVFKLAPNGDGTWTETAAYTFTYDDGSNPMGDLIFDAAGNLYGTNQGSGKYFSGTAFKLTPNGSGGWTSTVIHAFNYMNTHDGYYPEGGLILDAQGNLYGTASYGGTAKYGIVFKLGLVNGVWAEQILHAFAGGTVKDGAVPQNSLYLDGLGHIFGTTAAGGNTGCSAAQGCGTIYEVTR